MQKQKKTLQELSDMLLAEVQKEPGCGGVKSIGLNQLAEPNLPTNWDVKSINYGTSDPYDVNPAAKKALIRLQQLYDAKSEY